MVRSRLRLSSVPSSLSYDEHDDDDDDDDDVFQHTHGRGSYSALPAPAFTIPSHSTYAILPPTNFCSYASKPNFVYLVGCLVLEKIERAGNGI